jgi:AmmeMemoRadiSam system protein B
MLRGTLQDSFWLEPFIRYRAGILIRWYLSAPSMNGMRKESSSAIPMSLKHPLGDLSVNMDKIDELLSCTTAIEINDIPHLSEHCLEVLLPWIYTSCPGASIIPILVGAYRTSHIHSLTRALELTFADCLDTTLFVITTNLSAHFDDTEAFEQSKLFLNMLQERKTEEIVSLSKSFQISACGAAGVAAFLACNFRSEALSDSPAAGVSNKPVILGQASIRTEKGKTSSVLLEEPDKSVHYAALCVPMR